MRDARSSGPPCGNSSELVSAAVARRRLARWWSVTARGTSIYASGMPWTPYADLDELIEDLLGHWRRILGDGLAGAWIQGAFALGAGDLYSDYDWIVATHAPLTKEQVAALRRIHDDIPTREGHWPHDIEGSYAPFDELASVEHLGRRWLFNDQQGRGAGVGDAHS